MKKRIAIDMDEVMADLHTSRLELYQKEFNVSISNEQLPGKKLFEIVPPEHVKRVRSYLWEEGFFRSLAVMPDAYEVILELSQSYEIFVATAAMEVPHSFREKYDWLQEHFDFIDPMNYIFCGHKYMLATDYLIDDTVLHHETFPGLGILFDALHNAGETRYPRAKNWREVPALLQSLDATAS